jgi:hypothetical protein
MARTRNQIDIDNIDIIDMSRPEVQSFIRAIEHAKAVERGEIKGKTWEEFNAELELEEGVEDAQDC